MQMQLQTILPTAVVRLLHIHRKEERERAKTLNRLKQDLDMAKSGLSTALTNFNNVKDPQLIDMYIYRIQSAQTQYDHILQEIKEVQGIGFTG